jgi:hypothetical protein
MKLDKYCRFPALGVAVLLFGLYAEPCLAQDRSNCSVPSQLEHELQSVKLVLMGEVHGTTESPKAFGAAVCYALEHGRDVSVGLELNPDQIDVLASYFASNGDKAAVEGLLHSTFWTRPLQDGRSSAAMLALVERLRQLKQHHPTLAVFVLDDNTGPNTSVASSSRDQRMANRVRAEHVRRPQALVLTLTGNVHNRLKPISLEGLPLPKPMGVWLADLSPASVLLASNGGSAWMCTSTCAVQALVAQHDSANDAAQRYHELPATEPYTSQWSLGVSTASLPAINRIPLREVNRQE